MGCLFRHTAWPGDWRTKKVVTHGAVLHAEARAPNLQAPDGLHTHGGMYMGAALRLAQRISRHLRRWVARVVRACCCRAREGKPEKGGLTSLERGLLWPSASLGPRHVGCVHRVRGAYPGLV